jgi:hypothetical protein
MTGFLSAVVLSIEHPDYREPDAKVGRERLFKRGGPDRWICVVLQFAGDFDRVVTAFSRFPDPGGKGRR